MSADKEVSVILDELAKSSRIRVLAKKEKISLESIKEQALNMKKTEDFPFEKALKKEGLSIIAEVKKASPSKGIIAADFPYLEIAKEYEESGANAISCLTEPEYFKGSDKYLEEIAKRVKIPVLRKDFTVDPYMIYEAKILGASAILLIAAILSDEELKEYYEIADSLGLSALFEAHDEEEVKRCLALGSRIVGVNNRNLKDFTVDINNSIRLRELIPDDVIYVSESGIKTPEDLKILRENGTDAVLIGEMFMRSENKKELIESLHNL